MSAAQPLSQRKEDAMGRSVSYPSGSIVAFAVLEVEEGDDWEWEF